MSGNRPDEGGDSNGGMTVVTVPAEQARAVMEFVAGLDREDADVSGHMISGGALGSFGGALSAKGGRTLSGCSQTTGDAQFGFDWQCSDTDR